jgi:hypothetical protein
MERPTPLRKLIPQAQALAERLGLGLRFKKLIADIASLASLTRSTTAKQLLTYSTLRPFSSASLAGYAVYGIEYN